MNTRKKMIFSAQQVVLGLSLLPLITLSSTIFAYSYLTTHAPKAVTISTAEQVAKEKALISAHSNESYFIGVGHYTGQTSSKSKVQSSSIGKLFKVTKEGEPTSFITAIDSSMTAADLNLASGWSAIQVGQDSMWVPGACAQKPSWMLGDHNLLIDDGQYSGAAATHYYALYDTTSETFTDFGGSLVDDNQAKEKVLFIDVENDKLVFYIDQQDSSGSYAGSTSFKHSLAHHDPYIIRRVIDIPDLAYTDYRVPYDKPSFDSYHVSVTASSASVQLQIDSEGNTQQLNGTIIPNQAVALTPAQSTAGPQGTNAPTMLTPYDAPLISYMNQYKPGYNVTNADISQYFQYLGTSGHSFYLTEENNPMVLDTTSGTLSAALPPNNDASIFILGAE